MFVDVAKILIGSGNGGNGHISFRRELYVQNGGPDGGDGGKGGDLIFEVDKGLNNLLPFRHKTKYIAESGLEGDKKNCKGRSGEDLIVKVPYGTVVKDFKTGKVITDMSGDNLKEVILKGGRGGLGNARFVTSVMQAPRYAKPGEKGIQLEVILELKVIADVGLVGYPNVGKSSLISKISNARPEIANYHFTTLTPILGVVEKYDKNFVMADIPGIIEGASEGVGLGFEFLRHIERTKILAHVFDIAETENRDFVDDINIINNELKKYGINKKMIYIANKIDCLDEETLDMQVNKFKDNFKDEKLFLISALAGKNIEDLKNELFKILENTENSVQIFDKEYDIYENIKQDDNIIIKKIDNNLFEISGEKIDKMLGYTNIDTEKGFDFFQEFLKKEKIIDKLKEKGLIEGATVKINDIEFEYYE